MRISSSQYHLSTLKTIQQSTADYNQWAQKLASNKRILKPSDDPLGASMLMTLDSQLATLAQYDKNMDAVHLSLGQQETQLTSINNMLLTITDKVTQAANGHMGEGERKATGQELQILLQGVVDLLNSQDGSERYYFSGSLSDTKPFQLDASGTYQYKGDMLERKVPVSASSSVTSNIVGNAIDPNADFINQLNQLAEDFLSSPGNGTGDQARALLPKISEFRGQLSAAVTQIGGIRAALGEMTLANEEISQFTTGLKDDISVLDYAEGSIKRTEALAAYESSLRLYSSVSDLSLFKYL